MRLFGRVLEPVERLSEILFGLIMALTVTSAVSVTTADQMTIRTMLIAALGCNLVWGIIDAGMYLMARLGERGHNAVVAQAKRKAADREQAFAASTIFLVARCRWRGHDCAIRPASALPLMISLS
jgi:hypothetical protein